jgi:hypothetical protein
VIAISVTRIEEDSPYKRVEKDHVLIGDGGGIKSIMRTSTPPAKLTEYPGVLRNGVLRHPRIQVLEPMLPPRPDLGMILHNGILIDGKRKKEIRVKVKYVNVHLASVKVHVAFKVQANAEYKNGPAAGIVARIPDALYVDGRIYAAK